MDSRKGERPCWDDQRGSWTYLDIVGQLRGHQLVELLLAQGATGAVLPGVRLELGDQGADGGFHGDFEGTKIEEKEMKWKVGQQPLEERGCGGLTCRVMLCRVSLRSERTVYIYACYIFDRGGKKLGSAENTQPALVFFFFFSPMRTQTPDVIADWFPLAPQGTDASSNTPTDTHKKKNIPCMLVSSKGQNSTDGSTNPFPCVCKEGDSATASCKRHCQTTSNQTSRSPACLSTNWLIWKTWLECFGYGICLAVHMFEGICSTEWIFTCAAGSKWHRRASHYEPLWLRFND